MAAAMATTTALVARATEDDAPDVGAGVLIGAGVFVKLGKAVLKPLLLLLSSLSLLSLLSLLLFVMLPPTVLLEPVPHALSIGVSKFVSSLMPTSVQSPRLRLLTTVSTAWHAVEAQILVSVSPVGFDGAVNKNPESDLQVATFGLGSSDASLATSQSAALATARVAARVASESFMAGLVGWEEGSGAEAGAT